MNFDSAFDLLIIHEGGFSNHPDDPGGATMYGVTEAVARDWGYTGHMRDFTLAMAKDIYRDRYWTKCQCDAMPDAIRYPLFDAAVNSGPTQAVKWLQAAAGVKADGIIGMATRHAVTQLDPYALKAAMIARRLRFMTDLKNWPSFSRGWARRIASILES